MSSQVGILPQVNYLFK